MSLAVTNVGVSQNEPAPTLSSRSSTTTPTLSLPLDFYLPLAKNLTPSSQSFLWNPVTIYPGWYILLATTSLGLTQSSTPFYVRTGTNTSCLVTTSGATSNTNHATTRSTHASSITSQSVTPSPIAALSSSSSTLDAGSIVGISIGSVAFVICIIALLWLCVSRRKKKTRNSGIPKHTTHRWNGLSSTDFGAGTGLVTKRSRSQIHSHPSSVSTTTGPDFDDGVIGGEKISTTQLNFDGLALSTLPVLHSHSRRARPGLTCSASSSTSNVNDLSANRYSTQRKSSIDSSLYLASSPVSPQDLNQYMTAPDMSKSHSQTTTVARRPSFHSERTSLSLPPPPPISADGVTSQEIKQMNRQSLSRKRKPVPVYDPSERPTSPTSYTFTQPTLPFSQSSDSVAIPGPQLTHKSSFGPGGIEGKPLHYLIPDMPMPINH